MTKASEYPAGPARTDDEIIDAIVGLYKGFPEGSMIFHEAVNMLYQLPVGPLPELDVPLRALEARAAECKGYATLAVAEIMTLINSRPRSPQEDELVAIIKRAVQRRLDGLAVKCAERDRQGPLARMASSAANGIDEMKLDEALCQADRTLDAAVHALQEKIPLPASSIADVVAHAACVAALSGDDTKPEVARLTWAALELSGIQGLPQFARFFEDDATAA